MTDYETRYPEIEKVCLTQKGLGSPTSPTLHALLHCLFVGFDPLRYIFEKPVLTGRLSTWQMILIQYDILFVTQKAIKGAVQKARSESGEKGNQIDFESKKTGFIKSIASCSLSLASCTFLFHSEKHSPHLTGTKATFSPWQLQSEPVQKSPLPVRRVASSQNRYQSEFPSIVVFPSGRGLEPLSIYLIR